MYLNYRSIGFALACLFFVSACPTRMVLGMSVDQLDNGHSVLRGTLNVVLANKNGFVVITDSMVTSISRQGTEQLPNPAQKLFRIDERTVATIAGFGSGTIPTAPEFNTSAAGILGRYIRELEKNPDSAFSEKLTALSFTFNFYLSSFANISAVVSGDIPPGLYEFQMLLAGYEPDGTAKVARLVLRTSIALGPDGQRTFSSFVEQATSKTVHKEFVFETAGQDDIAQNVLLNPDSYQDISVVQKYAEAMQKDRGASMSLEEMEQLARFLIQITEQRYTSVGGERQLAILEKGKIQSVEQRQFPAVQGPMFFNLITGNHLEGPRAIVLKNAVGLWVNNHFKRDQRVIDGNYFFGNEFVDSQIRYDGGVTHFDPSNRIVNSVLVIGPQASRKASFVRELVDGFPWRAVCYIRQ